MRIINLIEESRLGGPQIRMVRVANQLKKLGCETIIYMPSSNSLDFSLLCEKNDIPFKKFDISPIEKSIKSIIKYFLLFIWDVTNFYKEMKNENTDIVHISGGSWQIRGLMASFLLSKKTIWHLNDTHMPWLILKLFKLLSLPTHGLIYASHKTKTIYRSTNQKLNTIIPSCVDTSYFNKNRKKPLINLKKKFQNRRVLISVANISPVKNFELLILSISQLVKKIPNISLLIIGECFQSQLNYKKKLLKLVSSLKLNENIFFIGQKNNIYDYLNISELYVCSSNYESSPISIWEAMSMNLPIISTKVGDLTRVIINGQNGYIIEKHNHIFFSKKIHQLLIDKKKLLQIGKANRSKAVKL